MPDASPIYDETALQTRMTAAPLVRALLAACGERIVILDADGHPSYCGAIAHRLLDNPAVDACLLPQAEQHHTLATITHLVTAGGIAVPLASTPTPLCDADGNEDAIIICVVDDTSFTGTVPLPAPHAPTLAAINHQVRNNLAIVCALMEMEMLRSSSEETRHRLRVSLARLRSLALMYNLIILHPDGATEISTLTRDVLDSVTALFALPTGTVEMACSVAAQLECRRSTYLCLVLTELAVQMLMQSPADGTPAGHVTIFCSASNITIRFVGRPCPAGSHLPDTLSREILTGLVEQSLHGRIMLATGSPFYAEVTFPLE